jgi:glycerol-1-phosphate dehydrogenase [NAD(P)+]
MDDLHFGGERVSHGACVAVGAMAVLRMYDWLLSHDQLGIHPGQASGMLLAEKEAEIRRLFGPGEIAERAISETRMKHVEGDVLAARLARLREVWPGLSARLRARLWSADRMAGHLARAGAPVCGREIGVDDRALYLSILKARFLRSRYTILDLLDECGLLVQAARAAVGTNAAKKVGT